MLKSVVQLYQIIFVISLSLIYGYCTNWFLEFIKAKLKIKIMRLPNKNLTHTSWTNIGKIGNWPSNISIIKSLIHTEFKNRNKLDAPLFVPTIRINIFFLVMLFIQKFNILKAPFFQDLGYICSDSSRVN
jgi:hypothetical protein